MATQPDDRGRGLLGDIIAYGERAVRHMAGLDVAAFAADEKTQDSVVRCLAIVGEAAWKMPETIQRAYPQVPWPLIAGMRHRLVHDYGSVDLGTIHRVVSEHLPDLIRQVKAIIVDLGMSESP